MANYNTQEVVTDALHLTKLMQEVLTMRSAQIDVISEGCVLESMVTGKLTDECTVGFEEGWSDCEPEDLIEWDEPEISDDDKPELDRLLALNKHEFFREVLKINKGDHITLQAAWTCSKMRLDGFGGSGLVVTRKGFLYITTSDFIINDEGVVSPGSIFSPWEELDEQAEAAVEAEKEAASA